MHSPVRRRTVVAAASIALGALLGGCSHEPTAPHPELDPAAADAAAIFTRLSDSLAASGADASVASGYRGLAALLRSNGRLSPVTISVDGVASDWLATAQQIELDSTCPAGFPCPLILVAASPVRSMLAWQKSNQRRVLQLTSSFDSDPMVAPLMAFGTVPFFNVATLTYFDGQGGAYVGTAGTQSIKMTPSDTPCAGWMDPLASIAPGTPVKCSRADFTVKFDGSVQPPAVALRDNKAAGSHTLAMAAQTVVGNRIILPWPQCVRCDYPFGMVPPIVLQPAAQLPATLTATVGSSDVTLTFTVTNSTGAPAELHFLTGQQYDFVIHSAGGQAVWRWGADKAFTQALGARTLAAGASVTYVERWIPTAKGSFRAVAILTSSSHQSTALAGFTVP